MSWDRLDLFRDIQKIQTWKSGESQGDPVLVKF
jgi:hypothetical protein